MTPDDRPPLFFYDLGSPYAWLAAERVDRVLARPPLWRPVLLGGIFHATGRSSWARTSRREAGIREVERRAAERRLPPPRWPEPWPNDGLQAMRAATYAHSVGRGKQFARAAFGVQFGDGLALDDPAHLRLAAVRSGLDGDVLVVAIEQADVKAELRAQTERALALGVTGVPALVVGERVWWGDDRLEHAAEALGGRD